MSALPTQGKVIVAGRIRPGSRVCDVYVGTTGAGKTTLCRARVKREDKHYFIPEDLAKTGNECPVIAQTADGHLICDTRGFDDTEVTDEQTATQIIQAIFDQRVEMVRVIWCVKEYDRPSEHLSKQAKFIASLMPEEADRVAFWRDSVALVLKGMDLAGQLEDETERVAPVKLALKNGGLEGIQIRRNIQIFEKMCVKQQKLFAMQSEQDRQDDYGVVKEQELSDFQNEYILSQLKPFKIIRTDDRCVKCGLTGDRRLWQPGCHAVFHHAHSGVYEGNDGSKRRCEAIEKHGRKFVENTVKATSSVVGAAGTAIGGLTAAEGAVAVTALAGGAAGVGLGAAASAATVGLGYSLDKLVEFSTRKWKCCEESAEDAQGCHLRCSVCKAWKNQRPKKSGCNAAHQLCECRSISAESCRCRVTIRD